MDFVNNTAHVLGGGIMVDSPDFISNFLNRFCFIRYSDPDVPPQSWEVCALNIQGVVNKLFYSKNSNMYSIQ